MGKKISEMDELETLKDDDLFEVIDSTELNLNKKNKQLRGSTIKAYIGTVNDGNFAEWDSMTAYSPAPPSTYVSYNGNIWEFIKATSDTGTEPGTNDLIWSLTSAGAFSHEQNKDQYLDFGGINEIAVANVASKSYADGKVSDTAYDATTWNGVTTIAPSKNAVRDEFENRVAKVTGNIDFTFRSASAFDITNDGSGGYSKGYVYFDSSEIEFGWGINYMSVGNVTGFTFRNGGGVITMQTTTGTLALTSDVTAAIATAEAYADSLVVGLWDDRGSFDASVNAYPSSGGSGSAGAIKKGDIWTISVAGTLPTGQAVSVGDTVRALQDTPGNTQANWAIAEGNLGYTPVTNARTLTINGTAFDLSADRSWTIGNATSLSITGTGGNGFINLINQASTPATPASGVSLYHATAGLSWVNSGGFTRSLTMPSANVVYTFPSTTDTLAGLGTAQTFSAAQTFSSTINRITLTAPATAATLTLADNTTTSVTGGGTIALGGFTLTVPATGTAALLGTANVFTANQDLTLSTNADLQLTATNSNAGTATTSKFRASNGTVVASYSVYGTGFTTSGLLVPSLVAIGSTGTGAPGILYASNTANTYHRWAIGGTAAGNQIMNLLTTGLSLTPTTLTDGTNALSVTATMPSVITAVNNAINLNITSAGSSSFAQRAFVNTLLVGYTGNQQTCSGVFNNAAAGTGTSIVVRTMNYGLQGAATATTVGYNVGSHGMAQGGLISMGVQGMAIVAKNNSTNGGGVFLGNNAGTTPTHFGVYAGLNTTDPTFASAALIADNAGTTDPIALFRDNGSVIASIIDGGLSFFGGSTTPTAIMHLGASTTSRASLRIASGTAPTSPNDGDIWNDGSDIKVRLGGVTYTLTKV